MNNDKYPLPNMIQKKPHLSLLFKQASSLRHEIVTQIRIEYDLIRRITFQFAMMLQTKNKPSLFSFRR